MRIGIITFHASYNFGSALQAHALQTVLEQMGHEVKIIDYRAWDFDQYLLFSPRHPRQTLKVIRRFPRYIRREAAFHRFWRGFFHLTARTYSYKDETPLNDLPAQFDCFVCGSDQIWNLDATRGVVEPFFLSFAGDRRRVAYAPSLAHTAFKEEYFDRQKVSELLGRFDALSVREAETVGLFQPLVDKKIEVALDPTMLLDAPAYEGMAERDQVGNAYIFVYLLRECPELVESAERISEQHGTEVVYVSEEDLPIPGSRNLFGIGPEEFVSLVAHARAVLTNSFHATVFSLKFHVPFRVFATDPSSSRMRDLLRELGLTGCLSESVDASMPEDVDWESADDKAAVLREGSVRYLKEALS